MKERTLNMTEGSPIRLLLVFALPLMLGNIFQQLYTVTDTAIIGKGVGINGLAALGSVDWLTWTLFSLSFGFTQGFSVMVSQKYGEKDYDGLRKMVGQSAFITLVISLSATVVSISLVPSLLKLIKVPEDLVPMASLYEYILFGGFAISMFYNFTSAMLRAVGDSRTPLIAMVVSSVINILLDSLAVFVLRWGIAGAAGATVFSQLVAGIFCFRKMWRQQELRFRRSDLKPHLPSIMALLKLGIPMALMNLIISIGGTFVQSVVNGFSIAFIAGYTATNKMYGLLEIAAISFASAVTTYVGQNYGAKQHLRIRKGVVSAVHLSAATSAVIGTLMILFGRYIIRLFLSTDDPAIFDAAEKAAYEFLVLMSLFLPVLYLLYTYRAALQGIGKTVPVMISGIIEFFFRVGAAMIVAVRGPESGVFWAEVTAWAGAAIFNCVMYYIYRRKLLTVE